MHTTGSSMPEGSSRRRLHGTLPVRRIGSSGRSCVPNVGTVPNPIRGLRIHKSELMQAIGRRRGGMAPGSCPSSRLPREGRSMPDWAGERAATSARRSSSTESKDGLWRSARSLRLTDRPSGMSRSSEMAPGMSSRLPSTGCRRPFLRPRRGSRRSKERLLNRLRNRPDVRRI